MSNYIDFHEIMYSYESKNIKEILNSLFKQRFLIYLTHVLGKLVPSDIHIEVLN